LGCEVLTSRPHWFYTRILRVPKCFSPQTFTLAPKSAHRSGYSLVTDLKPDFLLIRNTDEKLTVPNVEQRLGRAGIE
jgi:hypothetical protein